MPGPADPDAVTWLLLGLLLVYQLPAKPPGLKATVHRKLGAAGAVYLTRACALAPAGPAERVVMRRVRATIADVGGIAVLLRARDLLGAREAQEAATAVARYRSALGNYARVCWAGGPGISVRYMTEGLTVKRGSAANGPCWTRLDGGGCAA